MKGKYPGAALGLLAIFVLWTTALCFVDVKAIGPQGTKVGFAAINQFVHQLTGVQLSLYHLTDWLSVVPLLLVIGFALLGLSQWVNRRQLRKVDHSILVLGGFYLLVLVLYAFFELVVINYRPVLIDGVLEASYPSSTTMLVLCVIPTAVMQLKERIRSHKFRLGTVLAMEGFLLFMLIGRLLSGVHWFTDIVGGVLLSAGLVLLYDFFVKMKYR